MVGQIIFYIAGEPTHYPRCKDNVPRYDFPNFFGGLPWNSVLVPFFSLLIPFFLMYNRAYICEKVRHYPDFHVGWSGRRAANNLLLVPQASVWRTRLWSVLSSFHARLFCGYDRVPQNLFRYLKRHLAVVAWPLISSDPKNLDICQNCHMAYHPDCHIEKPLS